MSTDPFDNVGTLTVEIGQPTFVELIYTERQTGTSINQSTPTTDQSLARLAFKKRKPLGSHDPFNSDIVAIPQHTHTIQYPITQSTAIRHQNLDFGIIKNLTLSADCITTSQNQCNPSGCQLDIVIVLDITATMVNAVNDLLNNLPTFISQLDIISGTYRIALITFKDTVIIQAPLDAGCMKNTPGNLPYAGLITSLELLTPSGIGSNSNGALRAAIEGEAGIWREIADKSIILITDKLPGGSTGLYDTETRLDAEELAIQAGICGINIIAVNVGSGTTNNTRIVMENYAEQSGGRYLEIPLSTNITSYIYSRYNTICNPLEPLCQNQVMNGSFDSTIAGWTIDGIASWASIGSNGYMILNQGSASQTVIGLVPGSRVQLTLKVAGVSGSGHINISLNDDASTQELSGGLNINNATTIEQNTIVPPNGVIMIAFNNQTLPNTIPIYIDDVTLCEIDSNRCGFGTRNLIDNSTFNEGIEDWLDEDGNQLSSVYWDSAARTLLVPGYAQTLVENLEVGQNLTLILHVLDNQPRSNDNLKFEWLIADANGLILDNEELINSSGYPQQVFRAIVIPPDFEGPLSIALKTGGEALVKSVYCCHPGGYCSSGTTRIVFDEFDERRGGWSGGTLLDGAIILSAPGTGNDVLQQTVFDLDSTAILNFSVNCLTEGGVIVEFIYYNNMVIDQFFGDLEVGVKSFTSQIPSPSTSVTIKIRSRTESVRVDDILLCTNPVRECGGITDFRSNIQWNGIPRYPTNFFNFIARLIYRDPVNPFNKTIVNLIPLSDGRWGQVVPTNCSGHTTTDFWKQEGVFGTIEESITSSGLNPGTIGSIKAGNLVNLSSKHNWLWSVPASQTSVSPDGLVTIWEAPPDGLIESIEILFLANTITPISQTDPVCSGTYLVQPDPAISFDLIIRFVNHQNKVREFRETVQLSSIHQNAANFTIPPWDTISAMDFGIRGTRARWESVKFDLDIVDGSGLDQCSKALIYNTLGSAKFNLLNLAMIASGRSAPACQSTVLIEEINQGQVINEVQSIIIPTSSGGTWTITFTVFNITKTALLRFDAEAADVRLALASLSNIQTSDNIDVSGAGTDANPFVLTFMGELGGRRLDLVVVNVTNLLGTGTAIVLRKIGGTKNERQVVAKNLAITDSVILEFGGQVSLPIPYNASLNTFKQFLEAMSTIGVGNVAVTGNAPSVDVPWEGPWEINFQGIFANINVPEMEVLTDGYIISTAWDGTVGTNEIQQIYVTGNSGTFTLDITNPNPTGGFVTTGPISATATAAEVAAAIVAAASWLINNIRVVKLTQESPIKSSWTVEFRGTFTSTPMPLMVANGALLKNTLTTVVSLTKGGGINERQRLQVLDSKFGFFRLIVFAFGTRYVTAPILWNSPSETVENILKNIPVFSMEDSVDVVPCNSTNPLTVACHLVSFHPRFGNVPLMTIINRLTCNPLGLNLGDQPGGGSGGLVAVEPPYQYELSECDTPSINSIGGLNVLCTPGPITCKPGEGDEEEIAEICCLPSDPNQYSRLIIQRDLFDPYQEVPINGDLLTIKDLAVRKGLSPSKYNPYLRNFVTGALITTVYTTIIEPKMSIVLIGINDDTASERARLVKRLKINEILPDRMVWESLI